MLSEYSSDAVVELDTHRLLGFDQVAIVSSDRALAQVDLSRMLSKISETPHGKSKDAPAAPVASRTDLSRLLSKVGNETCARV